MQITHRGQVIAMKWPRKRGRPRDPEQLARLDWLRRAQQEYKRTDPDMAAQSAGNAALHLMRARDWWTHITAGRAWLIEETSGQVRYPRKFLWIMSTSMDIMAAAPGALIVRTDHGWRPLPAVTPGAALIMSSGLPAWNDGTNVDMTGQDTQAAQGLSQSMDAFSQNKGALLRRNVQWWEEIPPGIPGDALFIDPTGLPNWRNSAIVPPGYWRMLRWTITANFGGTWSGASSVKYLSANGTNLINSTIAEFAAAATSDYAALYTAREAFTYTTPQVWASAANALATQPQALTWNAPSAIPATQLQLTPWQRTSNDAIDMPKDFTVAGSNDGITWTTLLTVTNAPAWSRNETRTYQLTNP